MFIELFIDFGFFDKYFRFIPNLFHGFFDEFLESIAGPGPPQAVLAVVDLLSQHVVVE